MREWISALGTVVAWGCVSLLRVWAIPGFLDDTTTWARWFNMIPSPIVLSLCMFGFIVTGPLLWTSGWWWPRLCRKQAVIGDAAADVEVEDYDVQELKALVPIIERQIQAQQPMTLENMWIVHFRRTWPGEFKANYLRLTATLDALGIPSPPDDASRDDWYFYLIRHSPKGVRSNGQSRRSKATES